MGKTTSTGQASDELNRLLQEWRTYFGDLHEEPKSTEGIPLFVEECAFSWRMRLDAGEIDAFTHSEGLAVLERIERLT